ncbi:hypothetical protein PMZ80_007920 [Knufia obscura]|uniref:4'-phosphopantetheinyl transferase domain-containing protein n=2 Tax=Knufia TaxID=430999 RepID=A0AAN8I8G1_9EURO|nr:hypothetical protein PMZ80_007920 [Knufia obscura]KAK5957349.1 hypothetical protein OHC33_001722 [Knufia fluminis]
MRPFPFVVGTDIVRMNRFDPNIARAVTILRLARRMLHPKEAGNVGRINVALSDALAARGLFEKYGGMRRLPGEYDFEGEAALFKDQLDQSSTTRIKNFLAGRWAAKEAARKAWGAHLLGYKDVRVAPDFDSSGDPGTRTSPNVKTGSVGVKMVCEPFWGPLPLNEEAVKLGEQQEGRLSISHDGEYAIATVIAEPLSESLKATLVSREHPLTPLGKLHSNTEAEWNSQQDPNDHSVRRK